MNRGLSVIVTGFLFSMFWASASVAGKFGLFSVEPLVLFNLRFLGAGIILLGYAYVAEGAKIPDRRALYQLSIFGLLNTTLYLGIFVIALSQVSPGITTLAVALNPLFIGIFSALLMKRKVVWAEWAGIIIGMVGVTIAAYPLMRESRATVSGLALLALSMISYSLGSVYYASIQWKLSRSSINGWQVLLGGIFLLPFTFILHSVENHFDLRFWLSLSWLIFPVSIVAIQLWLRLLRADAVRASLWLYLCPVFGFFYAAILLHEPITIYTAVGTSLVLGALYLGQSSRKKIPTVESKVLPNE